MELKVLTLSNKKSLQDTNLEYFFKGESQINEYLAEKKKENRSPIKFSAFYKKIDISMNSIT